MEGNDTGVMAATTTPKIFSEAAQEIRTDLARIAKKVYYLKTHAALPIDGRVSEVIANVMLAFRHVEDAAMRVGKAIQAEGDGVSPLGGPTTPGR